MTVPAEQLLHAVRTLAAAALLARRWSASGSRHEMAKALIGGLARSGWESQRIEDFVVQVASTAGDEEARDRPDSVRTMFSRLAT